MFWMRVLYCWGYSIPCYSIDYHKASMINGYGFECHFKKDALDAVFALETTCHVPNGLFVVRGFIW